MIVVRKRAGKTEDRLDIRIVEVLSRRSSTTWTRPPGSRRTGSSATSRRSSRRGPRSLGRGLRLVRREWPTDIGPVDLMCRDGGDGWVAVEIKRVGTIEAVEQLTRYLERIRPEPAMAGCRGILAAQSVKPQAARWPRRAGSAGSRSISRCSAASASRS